MSEGTEIAKKTTMEDRLKDRLREDIGGLMTDEELKALIEKALDRIFFQPRVSDPTGYNKKHHPSWFEEEVHSLLKERMTKIADQLFEGREKEVQDALISALKEHGAALIVRSMLDRTGTGIQDSVTRLGFSMNDALLRIVNR